MQRKGVRREGKNEKNKGEKGGEGKGGRMKPFCKQRATKVPREERLMWYLDAK